MDATATTPKSGNISGGNHRFAFEMEWRRPTPGLKARCWWRQYDEPALSVEPAVQSGEFRQILGLRFFVGGAQRAIELLKEVDCSSFPLPRR